MGMKDYDDKSREKALIEEYRSGRRREAGEALLRMHREFIWKMAYSFHRPNEAEDLSEEGAAALLEALESFDPSRGLRLLTYAAAQIRRAMQVYLETSHPIRIADTTFRRLLAEGSPITEAPLDLSDAAACRAIGPAQPSDPSAEDEMIAIYEASGACEALSALDDEEREIMTLLFGIGRKQRTRAEIERMTGLDRKSIGAIERRAGGKLRRFLGA